MPEIKNFKKALRIIGIVLFIYILSRVNWPEFLEIFKEINVFYFLLGILLIIPSIFLRALRWRELVNSTGARISKKTLIAIFVKGLFLGVITPGKLGEFYRAKYLAQTTDVSLDKALFTVVFDKITELFVAAFLGILAILALSYFFDVNILLMGVILVPIVALGIYFMAKRGHSQKLLKFFLQIFLFDFLKKKAEVFFNGFFEEAKSLTKILIIKLFYYELLLYFLMVFVFFFMALSLGINIPLWYLCAMVPLVSIIAAIPISILGLGTREATFIFLFSLINLSLDQAVALSFLIMIWSIFSGLPGFILIYFPFKILK
ncbi:MAG: lysylphosphatidylglycerol synthase transmembrane domain-containing protein [Candidatus Nealsonbacteria bacterium]|nr:lysylphosphatidylglycerol synthase transmembrane domain-containing protein [Candidatus Nealsonbacteria bacterium]